MSTVSIKKMTNEDLEWFLDLAIEKEIRRREDSEKIELK